MVIYQN